MGTISNFKQLEQAIVKLSDVFPPEQIDKLSDVLLSMLVILNETAVADSVNKKLDEHWQSIHYIADQGKFNLFRNKPNSN